MVAVTYGAARIAAASFATKERDLAQPKGKGFFARFWDALIEARMQQARREIALHRHLMLKSDENPVERKELPFGS